MKVIIIGKNQPPTYLNKFSIEKALEYLKKPYVHVFNNEHFIIVDTEYQTIYLTIDASGAVKSIYILNFYSDTACVNKYNFGQFIDYLCRYYLYSYVYYNNNITVEIIKIYNLLPNDSKFNKTQNNTLQFKFLIDSALNITLKHEFPILNKYEDVFGFLKKQIFKLRNAISEFEKFISIVKNNVEVISDILGNFTEIEYTSANNCKLLKSTYQLIDTTTNDQLSNEKIKNLINALRNLKSNNQNTKSINIELISGMVFIITKSGDLRSSLTKYPYNDQFLYMFNQYIPFTDHAAEKIFSKFLNEELYYQAVDRIEFYKLKHT